MNIALLVTSRDRPEHVDTLVRTLNRSMTLPHEIFVVECGRNPRSASEHTTLWVRDADLDGPLHAQQLALHAARLRGHYDYYWFLTGDMAFDPDVDVAGGLVQALEGNARMAMISSTDAASFPPEAHREHLPSWRRIEMCSASGCMVRATALDDIGFLDLPWRETDEARQGRSSNLEERGWFVAESPAVSHRRLETSSPEQRDSTPHIDGSAANRMLPDDDPATKKLHLGCGSEHRDGWINIDTNPDVHPDIVSDVTSLPMLEDDSADVIEACHLFEHLAYHEALAALREWSRLLKPGGALFLELPNLERCIEMLGEHTDREGHDLGMIGIYGWPPAIEKQGVPQMHKWGWTQRSLGRALQQAGFDSVEFGPITQTWRRAAKTGRDFRVRATMATAAAPTTDPQSTPEPRSLGTEAPVRVFAWPRYDDPAELNTLFHTATPLVGRDNASLCLRLDPELDPDQETAVQCLLSAHERTLGGDADLELLLLTEPLTPEDWPQLGRSTACVVELPSSAVDERRDRIGAMNGRRVRTSDELAAALDNGRPASPAPSEPRSSAKPTTRSSAHMETLEQTTL